MDRQAGLLAEKEIEPANQRAAAGHYDTAIDDVAGELGRRNLERAPHCIDDLLNRLLDGLPNLAGVHAHGFRDARYEIASLDFHLALFAYRRGRSDVDLDQLRGGLADQQVVILAHELHDRNVELIAAGTDRRVADDA